MKLVARYAVFATPMAPYRALIASTPGALAVLLLCRDEKHRLEELARHFELRNGSEDRVISKVRSAVESHLRGEEPFHLPVPLNPWWADELDLRTYQVLRKTLPGETMTYGEVARRIGHRGLARRVDLALSRNWTLVAIPCHRVVAANGDWGRFRGGIELKLRLLEIERRFNRPSVADV